MKNPHVNLGRNTSCGFPLLQLHPFRTCAIINTFHLEGVTEESQMTTTTESHFFIISSAAAREMIIMQKRGGWLEY